MSDLRKAAKAVLDRWDGPKWDWLDAGPTADLMKDLRAALAEPVQEPVAWRAVGGSIWGHKGSEDDTPLYEHPQREPLTDKEIHDCFQQRSRDKTKERRLITRAIERAHGIGGKYEY